MDSDPAPPLLAGGFEAQDFNVNIADLAPGMVRGLRLALNTYHAVNGYQQAGKANNTVGWTNANPKAWELVSFILAERMKALRNG